MLLRRKRYVYLPGNCPESACFKFPSFCKAFLYHCPYDNTLASCPHFFRNVPFLPQCVSASPFFHATMYSVPRSWSVMTIEKRAGDKRGPLLFYSQSRSSPTRVSTDLIGLPIVFPPEMWYVRRSTSPYPPKLCCKRSKPTMAVKSKLNRTKVIWLYQLS